MLAQYSTYRSILQGNSYMYLVSRCWSSEKKEDDSPTHTGIQLPGPRRKLLLTQEIQLPFILIADSLMRPTLRHGISLNILQLKSSITLAFMTLCEFISPIQVIDISIQSLTLLVKTWYHFLLSVDRLSNNLRKYNVYSSRRGNEQLILKDRGWVAWARIEDEEG